MTKKFITALSIKLAIFLCFSSVLAQPGKKSANSEAIVVGETLTYEGKMSKAIFRGISVADLSFTVARTSGDKDYLLRAEARSKGSLTRLFRFSFLQRIDSTVETENFRVLKTTKHDEQRERVRESEAFFDYDDRRVTYTETDPNDRNRPPRRIASALNDEITLDMISGIYHLRRLPLAVGKTFQLSISDSGLIYKIPVRVTAREQQDSVLGEKIWCFRVEPEIFGKNRILEQKGNMIIWIADTARRIPVRAQINTDGYKIEVKLKKVSTQS